MNANHPDYALLNRIRTALFARAQGEERLRTEFPRLVREAIEFVLDPVLTARNRIKDLEKVEKTFIGLKIEHQLRDFLNVPKGLRDLVLDGLDVDVKNTVTGSWMIPPESYRGSEPLILIAIAEDAGYCQLGMLVAKAAYLNKGQNRDAKLSVSAEGRRNIFWIIERSPFPESRWAPIEMSVFRQLRSVEGGTKRAALFFQSHLGKRVHRSVVQSLLHDQDDFMKRLRRNGGARDLLDAKGITLLSGVWKGDQAVAAAHKITLATDEFLALQIP